MRILLLIFFMLGIKAFAQLTDNVLKTSIDSMIQTKMLYEKAVGVAIGIVKNGEIWYNKGYGSKKLNTNNPIDSLTNFHLASISKVFVATAVMQLVEQGRINLEDKLLKYIPLNELKDERIKDITIRQLLTHTSGFPDVNNYHWANPKNDSLALGNYAQKCIATKKLIFNPGARFEYSNMAFEVLGHVVEKVSQKNFDEYESDFVLSKAGLNYSNFDYSKIDPLRRSSPHIKLLSKVLFSKTYPYNREHGPSSTLNSCTYDMCKWMLEMLKIYDDKSETYQGVIKHQTLKDMWSNQHSSFSLSDSIGLTWDLLRTPLGLCAWHSGGDLGYLSMLVIYPEQKLGVILLVNGDYPERLIGLPYTISLLVKDKIKKIPIEHLRLLEGEYVSDLSTKEVKHPKKFLIKVANGKLVAIDGSTRFNLIALGSNEFLIPQEGVSLLFTTSEGQVTGLTFADFKFKKIK